MRDSLGLSPREGRRFGVSVGAAFLAIGALLWWRGHATVALAPWALGALLCLGGLFVPGRLGGVYRGWMALARAISRVTTPVFMAAVYFLVLLPSGLALRAFGVNPIERAAEDGSYWVDRERPRSDLQRQF